MHNRAARLIAASLFVTLLAVSPCIADSGSCSKLAGTWRFVSGTMGGQPMDISANESHIKHVTDTQFTWVTYKNDTKELTSALGGTCSVAGDSYTEIPQYGLGEVLTLLRGKEQKFTWKLDEDRWYSKGQLSNGTKLEEVWERVKQ